MLKIDYFFLLFQKGGISMRRVFCLLLVLVMMFSLCVQAFADGDVLYCRMCGKQIPIDSKVCPYCGVKVVFVTDETHDKAQASEPKPAESEAAVEALKADPATAAAPTADTAAVVAEMMAAPPATDVKTGLSQAYSAPSPVTSVAAAPAPNAAIAPASPAPLNNSARADSLRRQVYVTKSPTSESVPYGGSCSFIAHAVNAASVTWYIYSSDGSIVTAASDAPYSVSGLYVSGGNSDTLYLSGIPSWWNGCQVQACFTGEGGPVYTDIARIWTYQPAQTTDTSGWSWWDWFCYYYRNDPYHWDYPWQWYNYWVRYPHNAPGWFRPGPHDFDLRPGQPKPPNPDNTTKDYDWIWDKWYDIDPYAFNKLNSNPDNDNPGNDNPGNGNPSGGDDWIWDKWYDINPDAFNMLNGNPGNGTPAENNNEQTPGSGVNGLDAFGIHVPTSWPDDSDDNQEEDEQTLGTGSGVNGLDAFGLNLPTSWPDDSDDEEDNFDEDNDIGSGENLAQSMFPWLYF